MIMIFTPCSRTSRRALAALNASNDLADLAIAHGVGLNHDEGLLDSHKVAFQVGSRVPKSHSGTRLDCIVTEF